MMEETEVPPVTRTIAVTARRFEWRRLPLPMGIGRNSTENTRRLVTFPSFFTDTMRLETLLGAKTAPAGGPYATSSAVRLTWHLAVGSAGRCDRICRSEGDH